jgi:hypothetical protein
LDTIVWESNEIVRNGASVEKTLDPVSKYAFAAIASDMPSRSFINSGLTFLIGGAG